MRNLVQLTWLFLISILLTGYSDMTNSDTPMQIQMDTSMGTLTLELYPDKAPKTVVNFVNYVNEGLYNGTIFHRVIPGFMIQGGGFTSAMAKKPTSAPIKIEANNGLKNYRGTIAMARTSDPNSATSQFFINLVNNDFLDFKSESPEGWGYAVFGKVIDGMQIVDKIATVSTGSHGGHEDVPKEPIVIEKVAVMQ